MSKPHNAGAILSIALTQNPVGAKHSPSNLSILRPSLFGNASPKTFAIHQQIPNRRDNLLFKANRVEHLRMEILAVSEDGDANAKPLRNIVADVLIAFEKIGVGDEIGAKVRTGTD